MGVAGVAGEEDAVVDAERVGEALVDVVARVPLDVLGLERVRVQDLARRLEDEVGRELRLVGALAGADLDRELDVEAYEISLLRRR